MVIVVLNPSRQNEMCAKEIIEKPIPFAMAVTIVVA